MKKLISKIAVIMAVMTIPMAALAASTSPLSPYYRSVYCYTGVVATSGTYWKAQLTRYPDYYATNNAYFLSKYGPTTRYCPA